MNNGCRVYTLFSGSGGNCTFVRVHNETILIDAGKSAKKISCALSKIGEKIEELSAIFITHEHTDHISALQTISKKYHIPVYMTAPSATVFICKEDCPVNEVLSVHIVGEEVSVGDMRVKSFRTSHDSKMSVGYRIEFCHEGEPCALGIATDLGYVSGEVKEGLMGCKGVILECNHDEEMLRTGPYTYELKQRVSSRLGHLSNKSCGELAEELTRGGAEGFMLAHLSKENNTPALAFEAVNSRVSPLGAAVFVSSPEEPVELVWGDVC